jgi:hypothetical protein
MAVAPGYAEDPEALARLLGMVDGSLLPTVRAGRMALTDSGLSDERHVLTAVHHLSEVEAELACLLAALGVWTLRAWILHLQSC